MATERKAAPDGDEAVLRRSRASTRDTVEPEDDTDGHWRRLKERKEDDLPEHWRRQALVAFNPMEGFEKSKVTTKRFDITYDDEDDFAVDFVNPPPPDPDPEDPWSLAIAEARVSGEFILTNVPVDRKNAIDIEDLAALPLLYSLRLMKVGLNSVHPDLMRCLTLLKSLALRQNGIETLPSTISCMRNVESIDLSANRLTRLHSGVGDLGLLVELNLSSNQLTRLPASVGRLKNLKRLILQSNNLQGLPLTFGGLESLTVLNLTSNQFSILPEVLVDCFRLRKLFASHNRIRVFPAGLSLLKDLNELHLCNNLISKIPRSVGALTQLRKLWLDWNSIQDVPPTVKFLGDTLEELKLQGNPLVFPPMSVFLKGLKHVFEWTKAKAAEHNFVGKRVMVQEMQGVLHDAIKHKLTSPAFLSSHVSMFNGWKGEAAQFYCAASDMLFSTIVPAVNRFRMQQYKERRRRQALVQAALVQRKHGGAGPPATPVREAVVRLSDAASAGIVPEGTVDPQPSVSASLATADESMMQGDDEPLAAGADDPKAYIKKPLPSGPQTFDFSEEEFLAAIGDVRDEVSVAGIPRHPGHFRKCDCRDALGRRRQCIPPRIGFLMLSKTDMWKLRSKAKEGDELKRRVAKTKARTLEWLQNPEGSEWLDAGAQSTRQGLMQAIKLAQARMARLKVRVLVATPMEKKRLKLVEERDRKAHLLVTKRKEKMKLLRNAETQGWKDEYQKDVNAITYKLEHLIPENGKLELLHEEAEKIMDQAVEDDEAHASDEAAAFTFVPHPVPTPSAENSAVLHEYLSLTIQEIEEYAVFAHVAQESYDRVDNIKQKLVEQLVDFKTEDCIDSSKREFEIIRKVFLQWMNIGLKRVFLAWADFADASKEARARLVYRDELNERVEIEGRKVEREMFEMERQKWITHYDQFTELPYYEHSETGEVVWEIPDRGWVDDRAALMSRAAEREQAKLSADIREI